MRIRILVLLVATFFAFGCSGGSDEDENYLRDENVITVLGGEISFGVEIIGSEVRPWADGPAPTRQSGNLLRDIDPPFGTLGLTWTGWLVGYTDTQEHVSGDVRLHVYFDHGVVGPGYYATLEIINITDVGISGIVGKLSYDVFALGSRLTDMPIDNPFETPLNEQEHIEGQFFGLNYEGVGGTLKFDDLTAAFGGSR